MKDQRALALALLGFSAWCGEASAQTAPPKLERSGGAPAAHGAQSPSPGLAPPATATQPGSAPVGGPPPEAVSATASTTPPAPAGAPASPTAFAVPQGYVLVPVGSVPPSSPQWSAAEAREREEAMIEDYREGDPVPSGYRVVREPRKGLVVAGSIVGGIAYGFSVVGAVGDDFNHKSAALLIPGLGPWLMLAFGGAKDEPCSTSDYSVGHDCTFGSACCGDRAGLRTVLALDGLMQVAGFTMLAVGIGYPKARLVRRTVELSMVPLHFGQNGYGFGAVGRF